MMLETHDKEHKVNFASQRVTSLCNSLLKMPQQPVGGTLLSAGVSWGGSIKVVAAGKINNPGEKGMAAVSKWDTLEEDEEDQD